MTEAHEVLIDVTKLGISDYALSLFRSGHPRDAVRHEAQDLLNELQELSGRKDLDGTNLVQAALADNDPLVAFNELTTRQERNEHAASRFLLLGVTRGARNVCSHDVRIDVSREEAVIWLGVLGRLRNQLERAEPFTASSPDDASR